MRALSAPTSKTFRPQPPPAVEEAVDEPPIVEDEEVRVAMEMAFAAAQNPKMSAADIRKLVSEKNKQVAIVDEVQHQKEQERVFMKQKEREENLKRRSEKRQSTLNWWKVTAGSVVSTAAGIRDAAEQGVEAIHDRIDRRLYADDIKNDEQYQELRRKIKVMQKTLKAHRLQGNRMETRHTFKRQREEKKLMQIYEKLDKTQKLFVESSYNIHEYAKAMMRASRKWKKKGTDEELALEAQLCRNMHQMLAIEKQKSKVKKSTREIKKYLQRCKSWLSDKQALCEMNIMTLDATNSSMMMLYDDTLRQQDALIARLKASDEFKGADLDSVELANWNQFSSEKHYGPSATLNALRGLPISDSIRLRKGELGIDHANGDNRKPPPFEDDQKPAANSSGDRPEIYIETKDDASVSSHLSDPDEDVVKDMAFEESQGSLNSENSMDFGNDAPWVAPASNLGAVEEETSPPEIAADIIPMGGEHPSPLDSSGGRAGHQNGAEAKQAQPAEKDELAGETEEEVAGESAEGEAINKSEGPMDRVDSHDPLGDDVSSDDNENEGQHSSGASSPLGGARYYLSSPAGKHSIHSYSASSAVDMSEHDGLVGTEFHENTNYLSDASPTENSAAVAAAAVAAKAPMRTDGTVPTYVSADVSSLSDRQEDSDVDLQ